MILIQPARRWRMLDLRELWAYRELAVALCLRDLKLKYRQTFIGVAWGVIKPVLTMLVFTLVFGHIAGVSSGGQPYAVFLFAALLPWQFFSSALSASANSVLGQQALITKVYFPRLIVPVAAVGACMADLLIAFAVLLVLMTVYGIAPGQGLLAVPLLLLLVMFTALGVGVLVAALSVAYRDFVHLLPFAIQLWLFLTPVVYSTEAVPAQWQWLIALNPMTGLVEAFRTAFLGGGFDIGALGLSAAMSLAMLAVGVMVFERCESSFADVI
jgi:lipopolysaccharide transport system permease protein